MRKGRVTRVGGERIELEHGDIPTGPQTLHVDCSAAGLPSVPEVPVFDGDLITLQMVRTCQPTFSAALIGFVEGTFDDTAEKNRICTPISLPTVPEDWLRMLETELANRNRWSEYPEIDEWMAGTRLDPFTKVARVRMGVDAEATDHLKRYLTNKEAALERLPELRER